MEGGRKYYARAYALNPEGISYGASEKFYTTESDQPLFMKDAQPVDDSQGWWSSSWFGEFYEVDHNGWILRAKMGWMFTVPDVADGIWLWNEEMGWIWTEEEVFLTFTPMN